MRLFNRFVSIEKTKKLENKTEVRELHYHINSMWPAGKVRINDKCASFSVFLIYLRYFQKRSPTQSVLNTECLLYYLPILSSSLGCKFPGK